MKWLQEEYSSFFDAIQTQITCGWHELELTRIDNTEGRALQDGWSTEFYRAAVWGYDDILSSHLADGDRIDLEDQRGHTALHYAAFGGDNECTQMILAAGADVNAVDKYGRTPLHLAAANGWPDICSILLDAGASVSMRDKHPWYPEGNSPLHYAISSRNKMTLDVLLKAGAEPDNRAVGEAADTAQIGLLSSLLEAGASPDASSLDQRRFEIKLAARGVISSRNRSDTTVTPLMRAAFEGKTTVVSYLLQKGANPNQGIGSYETPLRWSAVAAGDGTDEDRVECFEMLVRAGARLDDRDPAGNTLADYACREEWAQVVLQVVRPLICGGG